MRIAILTNQGSLFGKKVLNKLINQGTRIEGIIVVRQPLSYHWKLFRYVWKRVGIFDALYFSLERFMAQLKEPQPAVWQGARFISHYDEMGAPVFYTTGTNSTETIEVLKRIAPDILILGQTGIIKPQLLAIPTIGTLNAHPGLLPYYRGIECAKWAILNEEFHRIGSSVHWVDRGVDTGDIIARQVYDLTGSETIETLDEHLYELGISLLARVVARMKQGEILSVQLQQQEDGKQYFKMPRRSEVLVKKKLEAFLVRRKLPFDSSTHSNVRRTFKDAKAEDCS